MESVEKEIARGLNIDTKVAQLVLTRFLQEEIYKTGFRRAVLGLSGGIDSALACFLAARALGPANVLAVRMPYQSSSPESLAHAQLVIDELGVQSEDVDLTEAAEALYRQSADINAHRRGNVLARLRMTILFDRSAAFEALVIGTSNKTEILLGYGTIYGDLASALNPVGDLYKTQVRQLASAMGVPTPVLEKAPSADLIPGQTDEADLGFSYAAADRLLYLLVDERYSFAEAEASGFESAFIHRIMALVRASQFKRTLPIIPKISGRTVGHDFRYLRDWGT